MLGRHGLSNRYVSDAYRAPIVDTLTIGLFVLPIATCTKCIAKAICKYSFSSLFLG